MKKDDKEPTKLSELSESFPVQLSFFNLIEDKEHSNTFTFFDRFPKFVYGKKERIEGRFLDPIERKVTIDKASYRLVISPASIKVGDEKYIDYFPGLKEELVLDALIKLSCSSEKGLFLDKEFSVVFSIYELMQELKENGHTFSRKQVINSLLILSKSNLEISSSDGDSILYSNFFTSFGLKSEGNEKCFVRFNPLISKNVLDRNFRLIDYRKCMSYKTVLARWLHKRMSQSYIQASFVNKFKILLSTVINDSGVTPYEKISNNLRELKKSLDELKAFKVVFDYEIEKRFDNRRLVDALITIRTADSFNNTAIKSNKRLSGKLRS